ncbi:hypothetical protein G9A89_011871 [Geosiphon pyriformis]|nr:hypothetical protein G9A89_011871 [Geosiphon pyriformis]
MIRAKSKKAAPDICSEISNKISTREALFVIETTKQNVLEAFLLPSNRDKLPLIAIEAISSSLAGFLPVKIPSKKHTWISPSVASTPTKSPKVFNNRPVNKLVFFFIDPTSGAASATSSKKMVKKTKSSKKWKQLLVSAIVIPNSFVVLNKILNEIFIASSVFSNRSLLVLEVQQSPLVKLSVLENWTDQIETELFSSLVFGMASTLVLDTTFKIKLAHIKAVFQSVHGFLGAKSVSKNNIKLFCVEFASQVFLEAVFLVEFTSSVHLATLKIAKSLVVSESGSLFATVVWCDMPLDVFAANIKTALNVFNSVTHVVLKSVGIWQYVVVYFEKLDSVMSALNYWSVLVDKDSIRIFSLMNQNKTILFHDKFKTKLSGHHFQFALVTFGSQADLNFAIIKTELGHLAVDYKIFPPLSPKFSKMFTSCFVGSKFYAKTFALLSFSGFLFLSPFVSFPVVVSNSLVLFYLSSLESNLTKLFALVEFIVKPIGSLVTTFEQFINDDLVLSSALEVVSLKKKCCMENINMSDNSGPLSVVDDEVFSNLMSLWEHKFLVGLVSCSTTLFSVIQKMSSLDKFSSIALV